MGNVNELLSQAGELVIQACNEINLTNQKIAPQILCQLEDAGEAISMAQLFIDDESEKREALIYDV